MQRHPTPAAALSLDDGDPFVSPFDEFDDDDGVFDDEPGGRAGRQSRERLDSDDIDRIVRGLEDRILAELERRGGRYAGVF